MPLSPETGLGPDKNPEIVFPFPAGDRESKEEPMSEFRRDDTASWDAQEVRQAQWARREAASVLLASAILAGVGWMLGSDFCAFNRGALRETSVEVTAEDSVSTVADKLQDAGLIKYKWFFKLYAGISHADKKIGIGTYTLNTEMDYRALILGMHNSSGNLTAETVTVTIPEGYTVRQTIRLLAEKGVNTEENLLEAARTRRYPLARLRRMLLAAYLELPEPEHIPYLRLLAASSRGCTLLRQMRGAPVLTKPADVSRLGQTAQDLFTREAGWTDLYTLAYPDLSQSACGADWRAMDHVRKCL